MVNAKKCIGCCTCASICPVGAIDMVDGKAVINPDICIKCHSCENACPVNAIKIDD